jgi:hypothetical protein
MNMQVHTNIGIQWKTVCSEFLLTKYKSRRQVERKRAEKNVVS